MPTLFSHRLLILVPAARYAAMGAWWAANIDAMDDLSLWPKLNASGLIADAESHRWCSIALIDADLKKILLRMCAISTVTPPTAATWNGWTRAQKQAWLLGVRGQFFTDTGIWVALSDNDGTWSDPEADLTARSLKRRQAVP